MTEANSTARVRPRKPRKPTKPAKPFDGFPLFAHQTKRWAKKILGRTHYFGPWNDWQGALDKYNREKEALHAGRKPRTEPEGLTVRELLNHFLTAKRHQLDTRELSPISFQDYNAATDRIAAAFGLDRLVLDLGPEDFDRLRKDMAKTWGPVRLGAEIQRVRTVFKFGFDATLIDRPVRYGPGFVKPSKRIMRKAREDAGERFFEAKEIRDMLAVASPPMRAMIAMGANCGFGNSDCGHLPLKAIDLDRGWHSFARPKTGIARRCPLWPETVEALKSYLEKRPKPKRGTDADLVFITRLGLSWSKEAHDSPVTKEMKKIMTAAKIAGRKGLGFYSLRRCFETVGGGAKDQIALDFLMGHADESMAGIYRQHIEDDRLLAVSNHVRTWLFGPTKAGKKGGKS